MSWNLLQVRSVAEEREHRRDFFHLCSSALSPQVPLCLPGAPLLNSAALLHLSGHMPSLPATDGPRKAQSLLQEPGVSSKGHGSHISEIIGSFGVSKWYCHELVYEIRGWRKVNPIDIMRNQQIWNHQVEKHCSLLPVMHFTHGNCDSKVCGFDTGQRGCKDE